MRKPLTWLKELLRQPSQINGTTAEMRAVKRQLGQQKMETQRLHDEFTARMEQAFKGDV